MATRVKKNNGSFKGKSISIGIDVHKLSWRITAVSDGEVVMAVTMSKPTYSAFKKLLGSFKDSTVRVAYEAGLGGFGLCDNLTDDDIECIVTPPSLIPTESGNRVKIDKKDSLKLARLLDSNMLKRVWVLSPEQRAHRQLVRTRRQIVDHRSDVMRQIKSLLLFHNIRVPFPARQQWTGPFVRWLNRFGFEHPGLTMALQSLVALFDYLSSEKKRLTQIYVALTAYLLLCMFKFLSKLPASLQTILRVIQLKLFRKCYWEELFKPPPLIRKNKHIIKQLSLNFG
jgi:hypothetical protein